MEKKSIITNVNNKNKARAETNSALIYCIKDCIKHMNTNL